MSADIDPENVVLAETVDGALVELIYVETWDGLHTPIGLRRSRTGLAHRHEPWRRDGAEPA